MRCIKIRRTEAATPENDKKEARKTDWLCSLAGQHPCPHITSCHLAGPRSAVGNVSGYRCEADCRSRGREFDPGPVPFFRGD